MNWRRLDTLFTRLFLLMWAALVASHFIAFSVVVPSMGRGGPPPAGARSPGVPTMPSLPPGNPFNARPGPDAGPPRPGPPPNAGGPPHPGQRAMPAQALWLDYGIRILVIALAAALGARWLSAPMRRLSAAATALGQGLSERRPLPQIDEHAGTVEVRQAASVFNAMARRLQEQFDARSLHMAAISHDLRTPLTRMRMRLETSADPDAAANIADIHEMNELVDSSLAVLREQRDGEPPNVVDVTALLQALVDDHVELGHAASLDAGASMRVLAHPASLKRVVGNLLANAIRYGGCARVAVHAEAAGVRVTIDDDGPGIPPEQLAQAFQPWVRLESRPASDLWRGGHGLGLAIAKDLAERDGASLALRNRFEGGLRAELLLRAA
jgi:protein-histidine pros-kinase